MVLWFGLGLGLLGEMEGQTNLVIAWLNQPYPLTQLFIVSCEDLNVVASL